MSKKSDDPDNKNLVTNVDDILTIVDNEILITSQARENVKKQLAKEIEKKTEEKFDKIFNENFKKAYGYDLNEPSVLNNQDIQKEAAKFFESNLEQFEEIHRKAVVEATAEILNANKQLINQERKALSALDDVDKYMNSADFKSLKNIAATNKIEKVDQKTKELIEQNAEKAARTKLLKQTGKWKDIEKEAKENAIKILAEREATKKYHTYFNDRFNKEFPDIAADKNNYKETSKNNFNI